MSIPYLNNIDLNGNQMLNMRLQNLGTAPATPLDGFVYYSTATLTAQLYTSGGWVTLGHLGEIFTTALMAKLNSSYTTTQIDTAISTAVNNLISGSPGALDTLNELAAAMGDDANFAATMANSLANKVDKVAGKQLSTEDFTTVLLTKLNGIAASANNYIHPTGDGNSHVPVTSTTNSGKVLKAGSTANSAAWGSVAYSELTGVPTTLVKKYSVAIGNGTLTTIPVTHNLGTQDVTVSIRETATPFNVVMTDVQITSTNVVTLLFAVAPAASKYTVTVTG